MLGPGTRAALASHVARAVVAGLLVLVTATLAVAQGMYYQEVEKDGRIYVFNLAAEYDRWSAGGQFKGDARLKYGPKGQDVYFDSPTAIMLYNFKHGLQAENLTPAPPPPPPPAPGRISGYVFGDYYSFGDHHDPKFDGQHGFWIRRAYLTYDHTFSPKFFDALPVRGEQLGQPDQRGVDALRQGCLPAVDLYRQPAGVVRHLPDAHLGVPRGLLGLAAHRKDAGRPLSHRLSRDFGFGMLGSLNKSQSVRYAYQFGNESSTNSEIDKHKANRFSVVYAKPTGFAVDRLLRALRPRRGYRSGHLSGLRRLSPAEVPCRVPVLPEHPQRRHWQ